MKSKQDIEKTVEATLNSLDGLQPTEANEFLYTRIAGRLQYVNNDARYSKFMLRISLSLLVLVVINISAFMFLKERTPAQPHTTGANAFAQQYGLQQHSYSY